MFTGGNNHASGTLDLSGCSNLKTCYSKYYTATIKVPNGVESVYLDQSWAKMDFTGVSDEINSVSFCNMNASQISNVLNGIGGEIENLYFYNYNDTSKIFENKNFVKNLTICGNLSSERVQEYTCFGNLNTLESLTIYGGKQNINFNLSNFFQYTKLKSLSIRSYRTGNFKCTVLPAISSLKSIQIENCLLNANVNFNNLSGLTTLILKNVGISDLTKISGLKNLTTLNLSGNSISNLTPLLDMIVVTNNVGVISYKSLDLSSNTTLVASTTTGADNIDVIRKLHNAGLNILTLTGCNQIVDTTKPACQEYISTLTGIFTDEDDSLVYQ